ncbi:hypothetical protein [Gemmobacter nectariphilus]|uniref:hypothetical protein n=1 Tax=Gemmobacter nectariphilus TaxID=220343 RepID=UPI000417B51F|nr:hypothetical protein [Gemmobacter nectariphilus]
MNAHVSEDGGANDHSGPIIEIRLREDFLSHDAQCEADMASRIFDKTIRRFEMADVRHLIAVFVYAQDSEGRDPEITIATLDEIREISGVRPAGMHYLGYAAMFDADAREYFADCGGDYRAIALQELADELRSIISPEESATPAPR